MNATACYTSYVTDFYLPSHPTSVVIGKICEFLPLKSPNYNGIRGDLSVCRLTNLPTSVASGIRHEKDMLLLLLGMRLRSWKLSNGFGSR